MNKWKKIEGKAVHKNPWFWVTEDKVVRPDGKQDKYYLVHRKYPGVAVIAFDGKNVYLVNQYRYSFEDRLWELVAGKSESQDYLREAKKELKQETGLTASKWKYLGHFACAPGHTAFMGKVFLAEKLKPGTHRRDASEADMVVKKFPISHVDKMIRQGTIIDSWTITPWYFFKEYLKSRSFRT